MTKFKATLQVPFATKKLEKLMEISGIALAPGTYTGIDGHTIEYPSKIMDEIAGSIPGKTILWSHTKDESKEELENISVGFLKESLNDGSKVNYRGILYSPEVFPLVEDRTLHSCSLEINVQGQFDANRDVHVAEHATVSAMALTDRPAYKGADIQSHEYVTQVRLEALPEGKGGKTKLGENEDIADLAAGYPMPAETPWNKMSDKDKKAACTLFLKHQGYPLPGAKEELDALFEVLGVDLSKYTEYMKKCVAGGKSFKECAAAWKGECDEIALQAKKKCPEGQVWCEEHNKCEPKAEACESKMTALEKRVAYFEKAELERLVAGIKEIDTKFDEKKLLEGLATFDTKKAVLERYKSFIEEHKPKVKLEIGSPEAAAKLEERRKAVIGEMKLAPDLLKLIEEEK